MPEDTAKVRVRAPYRVVHEGVAYSNGDEVIVPAAVADEWLRSQFVEKAAWQKDIGMTRTEAIRAAHDAAVQLGAKCGPECAAIFGKSADGQSKSVLLRARAKALALGIAVAQRN